MWLKVNMKYVDNNKATDLVFANDTAILVVLLAILVVVHEALKEA